MEEQKLNNYESLSTAGKLPVSDTNSPPPAAAAAAKKKRRRGAMHLIKVALFMLRRRSAVNGAKSVDVVGSQGTWKRLFGSIRPLHLQNGSPRYTSTANSDGSSIIIQEKQNGDVNNDIASMTVQQPMSPAASSSSSSSPSDSSSGSEDGTSRYASAGNLLELESRYASAVNLQDLNPGSEEEEECEYGYEYDESGGDEMIDVKAEEFIAQFYQQMRLQRLNSIDRRYKEMIERSIS